jgi:hypothetical protein
VPVRGGVFSRGEGACPPGATERSSGRPGDRCLPSSRGEGGWAGEVPGDGRNRFAALAAARAMVRMSSSTTTGRPPHGPGPGGTKPAEGAVPPREVRARTRKVAAWGVPDSCHTATAWKAACARFGAAAGQEQPPSPKRHDAVAQQAPARFRVAGTNVGRRPRARGGPVRFMGHIHLAAAGSDSPGMRQPFSTAGPGRTASGCRSSSTTAQAGAVGGGSGFASSCSPALDA